MLLQLLLPPLQQQSNMQLGTSRIRYACHPSNDLQQLYRLLLTSLGEMATTLLFLAATTACEYVWDDQCCCSLAMAAVTSGQSAVTARGRCGLPGFNAVFLGGLTVCSRKNKAKEPGNMLQDGVMCCRRRSAVEHAGAAGSFYTRVAGDFLATSSSRSMLSNTGRLGQF